MRPAAAVVGALGLALLGCGGLFGAPDVRLESASGGPCATVSGVILTEPWKEDRALSVRIDGKAAEPLRLPAGEVTATFERPALPGHHTLEVEGASLDVDVPPVDVAADWPGWTRPPREGDPAEVLLRVTGACPMEELTLSAELPDDGRSLARREPIAGPAVRLDASGLPQGSHRLVVTLRRGELVVDERTLALSIAEPCTGPTCQDRDNDGFVAKKFGGPDCDDFDPGIHPGAVAFPDPDGDGAVVRTDVDIDCDGEIEHFDGPVDCAEGDPTIPRPEDPDPTGVDEDCDGIIDEGTIAYDDDGDGFSEEKGDCRDDDRTVSPAAKEQPDCKDNDCDGEI
ncbi:MAG: hypothetical protein KC621_23090, partial [Myxococcales bacterium]|nr:hypothetical protein [Myxococcales bacterium]